MKTFTIGFDLSSASGLELSFDERAKAEHISYLAKTEHYEMVLKGVIWKGVWINTSVTWKSQEWSKLSQTIMRQSLLANLAKLYCLAVGR